MKTVELEPSLIEDIKALLADEEMSERLHKYVSRMKAKLTRQHEEVPLKEDEVKPYTIEELRAELAEGVAEMRAGKGIPSEQVFREIREKHPWLRKAEAEEALPEPARCMTQQELDNRIRKSINGGNATPEEVENLYARWEKKGDL